MRRREDFPTDPEIVTALKAIEATLAGEPVDPRHAELAELALLLTAGRPVIEDDAIRRLDERLRAGVARGKRAARGVRRRRRARVWVWAPASAVVASLIAAVVIVAGHGAAGGSSSSFGTTASAPKGPISRKEALSQAAAGSAPRRLGTVNGGASTPAPTALGGVSGPALQPPTAGRKVIQGAQLSLSTSPQRVDQVSQEVYTVVGQENGIVKSSSVTANGAAGGYAQFLLSIPSSNLSRAMSELSSLQFARVQSRTDTTQDVTNQYNFDKSQLADAQALHTSLLKQLSMATTQAQIDSLQARIHDAENDISTDEAALHSLQRQIGYSQINLDINSSRVPVAAHSGGFTLGRAVRDAGRVLTVAAGVALIVLSALLPVGLLLALAWWIGRTVRRRSRQQALDLA